MVYSGQYVYPFSFMLPAHLPGSFEYYDQDNTAYIKYILEARALSSASVNHIKNEILLIVRQSPQYFQYPTKLSDTKDISTWCCMSKGSSTLNISYEKNYYCPEEKVNVICELDNTRCTLKANCIKLALIQTITLQDKKNRTKYLSRKLAESRYTGVYNAGQENTRTLELVLSDTSNPVRQHIDRCGHHYLFKEKSLISMLQATVKSSLIECKYHFHVTADYDSMLCCSGKPTIDIPIIMYIPDIRPNMQLYQPNNWNPQLMPISEVSLPSYTEVIGGQGGMTSQIPVIQGGMTSQIPSIKIEQGGMTTQIQPIQNNQQFNNQQNNQQFNSQQNNQQFNSQQNTQQVNSQQVQPTNQSMTNQTQPMNNY